MKRILFSLFVILCFQTGIAQSITGKVIDLKTKESIPYAGIKVSETQNLISNAEGFFTLSEANSNDETILIISYLGYVSRQITVGELKSNNLIVAIEPGIFELDNVDVSNVKPDANSIIAMVKKNMKGNYGNAGQTSKDVLFMREVNTFKPKQLEVEFTKSTGFDKTALKKANADINAFTATLISNPPVQFTDVLADHYTGTVQKDNKKFILTKLDVTKATKLKDENRSTSLEELQKTATDLFLKYLDTTKYYRIKSGLFGSRDTISFRKDFNKNKKKKEKKSNISSSKSRVASFMSENNFTENGKLDFINQSELYQYTYEGAIYSKQNEFVYVLTFKPKKSKAKYVGKLYISETDYAVIRADYNLAEGKTLGGANLKFLLVVKFSENLSKGTLIYKQNTSGEGYHLQYGAMESGQYIYLNRPLKFIELTDEEKYVVAIDLKAEGNSTTKEEFLNISHSDVSQSEFEKVKEDDFNYIKLKRYDPKIWKDYSAIEPLEEMKQFKAAE